jgi:hypothetical protein
MTFLTGAHPSEGGVETGTAQFGKASNPVGYGRLRVTNLYEILRCYFGISSSSEYKCCILLRSFSEAQLSLKYLIFFFNFNEIQVYEFNLRKT